MNRLKKELDGCREAKIRELRVQFTPKYSAKKEMQESHRMIPNGSPTGAREGDLS